MAINVKKRLPSYPHLDELITQCGGNLSRVGSKCGYSARYIQIHIKNAPEPVKIGLLESIAKAKALEARSRLLKKSVPVFIIPSEIKALVSLHYRLTDTELNNLEIDQVLATYDTDPDKPRSLKYKITWAELATELARIENMRIAVAGRNVSRWYLHVLLHWAGVGSQSPVFEDYDLLPEITFENKEGYPEVYLKYIEPIVRLLIKRLEQYL